MYDNRWYTKPSVGAQLNRAHPLSKDIIGYWLFNERNGTKVYDISGYNNNGTLNNFGLSGATSNWAGSPMGGGLFFDGTNDYVNCGSNSILQPKSNELTIMAWVTPNGFENYEPIVCRRQSNGSGTYNIATKSNGKLTMWLYTDAGNRSYDGSGVATLVAGKPVCLTLTYSMGGGLKGYVNGIYDGGQAANNSPMYAITDPLYFGYDQFRTTVTFNGKIDKVIMYSRELSNYEINILCANPHISIMSSPQYLRYPGFAPPPPYAPYDPMGMFGFFGI